MKERKGASAGERLQSASSTVEVVVLAAIVLAALVIESRALSVPLTNDRDCQCAAITRNIAADGPRGLLYPRVNFGGDGPGHLLLEFPLVNALGAVLVALFPNASDAILRLPSMAFSALAIAALFDLTRRRAGPMAALCAAALFAFFPLSLESGTSPKPDMAGLSLSIASLALLDRHLESGRAATGIASAACFSLSALAKLPHFAMILTLFGLIVLRRGVRALFRPSVLVASALATVPIVAWSLHAMPVNAASMLWPDRSALDSALWHMNQSGRFRFYFSAEWYEMLLRRFVEIVSMPGAILAAGGLLAALAARPIRSLIAAWAASVAVHYIVFPKQVYSIPYYSIAILPIAALVSGTGIAAIAGRLRSVSAAAAIVAAVILVLPVPFVSTPKALKRIQTVSIPKLEFGAAARRIVPPGELLIVTASRIGAWDGSLLYLSRRFGWKFPSRYIDDSNPNDVSEMRSRREARFPAGLDLHPLPVGFSARETLDPARLEDLRRRGARCIGYAGPPARWVAEQTSLVQYVLSRHPAIEVAPGWLFADLGREMGGGAAARRPRDGAGGARIVAWRADESADGRRVWRSVGESDEGPAFSGLIPANAFEPGTVLFEERPSRQAGTGPP